MNTVPEGWRQIPRLSPFNALVGPLYERRDAGELSIGLHIEEKHGNSRGIESDVRIQRIGARLAFADCYLLAGGVRIVRASAIFARSEKE